MSKIDCKTITKVQTIFLVDILKKNLKSLTFEEKEIWKNYVDNISVPGKDPFTVLNRNEVKDTKSKEKNLTKSRINITEKKLSKSLILLDKKTHSKLKNGRLKPERILDLHGCSYQKALSQVVSFITLAYQDEKRLILIITGKGNNRIDSENYFSESRRGVLKRAFPEWLESKRLSNLILNVTSAHFTHGGDGAYYVYLKKKKNSQYIST